MDKTRTTLLLFTLGVAGAILIGPCGAAEATPDSLAPAADPLPIAECPQCTGACSPWLGAWVGSFAEEGKDECDQKMIETFKFSMMNLTCDQFVLNLQTGPCEEKVRRAFPETDDVTEFVGVACKNDEGKLVFTAVGYGVKTHDKICHEVVFIAIKSGTISCPSDAGPYVVDVTETIEIFAAEQDTDCDGLPDECDSVICLSRTGRLKRIVNRPPSEPARSFMAYLEPCRNVVTPAMSKAFFKQVQNDNKLSFLVTTRDITDVTKVVIRISEAPGQIGAEAVTLCPIPPGTECKPGDFSGLLCCGTIIDRNCRGPLQGKKVADLIAAITENRASVTIHTKQNPDGELCGQIEDP